MKEKAFPGILTYQRIGEAEEAKGSEGMDLRDYFAAKAMQALINKRYPADYITEQAYKYADEMLKERNK